MIEERFAIGPDLILGIQVVPENKVDTSVTLVDFTLGPINGDDSASGSRIAVVPAVVAAAETIRTLVYSVTVAGTAGSYSWSLRRILGTNNVVINTGTGTETNQTSIITYTGSDALLDETVQLSVTIEGGIDATVTMDFISYTITWLPNVQITGLELRNNNLVNARSAIASLTFAGEQFQLRLVFRDETLAAQTITGQEKQKTETM